MRRLVLSLMVAATLLAAALSTRPVIGSAAESAPASLWRCFYLTCQTLHALDLLSPQEGWAVGASGRVLRWQAGTWTTVAVPTDLDLFGVWAVSPTSAWAVGGYSGARVALYWDGAAWTPTPFAPTGELPPAGPNAPRAISGWGDNLWMVGERGVAFHWENGRWEWKGRLVDRELRALQMVGPQEAWAVGGKREELSTTSEGAHMVGGVWQAVEMPTVFGQQMNYTALHFLDATNGWAVGEYYDVANNDFRGAIARYTSTTGWRIEAVSATPLSGIRMLSAREGWAVGWRYAASGPVATYLHYVDGVWFQAAGATSLEPLAVDVVGSVGWAVGYGGSLIRLGGATWTATELQANNNLRAVAFEGQSGWAAGAGGALLQWTGSAWQVAARPGSRTLNDLALSGGSGWAVGEGGALLRLQAGEWHAVSSPVRADMNGVALSGPDGGWAVGDAGAMLHLMAGNWTPVTPTITVNLNGVALSGDSGWAVGDRQSNGTAALLRLVDGAWQGASSPTGNALYSVSLRGDSGWAAGANGTILRLSGGTWQVEGAPANDPLFSETLFGVYALSPTWAYAVGTRGAILEYRDGVWLRLASPTQDALYAVAARGDGEAAAVGAYGAIVRGLTVTPRQYLPLLSQGGQAY